MTKTLDLIDTALVTGGAGGIGRAIAETLIRCGKTVVIAGRTESKLKDTAAQIGAAAYYVLDTGDTSQIADVSRRILADYPDLNCLVNNAGVQRPFTFPAAGVGAGAGGKGEADEDGYGFDLAKADQEIDINIRGPLHLTLRFLPHLLALPEGKTGVIMNVSSVLGFLPASVINPVYNGTKAWVHFFTTNLRSQYNLAGKGERLKIIEIAPPSVTTELHRERKDPHDNTKDKNASAMSLDEFMADVEKAWDNGDDVIAPGPASNVVQTWYGSFGDKYQKAVGG